MGDGGGRVRLVVPDYHLRQERLYRILAPFYDRFVEGHTRQITAAAISLLGDVTGSDVLDVGTGTGNLAFALAAAGARVTAVDLSPALLRIAAGKNINGSLNLAVMNAAELHYGDRSFDVACAAMMLHEMPEVTRDRALAELARVSRQAVLVIDYRRGGSLHWATRLVERLEMSDYSSYMSYPLEEKLRGLGLVLQTTRGEGQLEALLARRLEGAGPTPPPLARST
jgi:ubiquinone/menaquinone biosynthesis C-methylase UbiE